MSTRDANALIPPARGAAAEHFERVVESFEDELRATVRARLVGQCASDPAVREAYEDFHSEFGGSPTDFVAFCERSGCDIWNDCLYWTRASVMDALREDYAE